jgi:hypothetical protein
VNEHLSPRARTVVACIGIRQRARSVEHFVRTYCETHDRHDLSAACLHARHLRERCDDALRDSQLDAAGVPRHERRPHARRMD